MEVYMPQYNQYVQYALDRQPDNENLLQTTGFRFVLSRAPETVYFCQTANIPSISVGVTEIFNKHPTLQIADPKMTYDPLTLSFLVNEDMGNWLEIYNWMKEFTIYDEFLNPKSLKERQIDSTIKGSPENYQVDGTLVILNSNSRPQVTVTFKDMWPNSLGEIDLNATDGDASQITCTATFQYRDYSVEIY